MIRPAMGVYPVLLVEGGEDGDRAASLLSTSKMYTLVISALVD